MFVHNGMEMYKIELRPIVFGKRVVKRYALPPSLNARMHWRKRAEIGAQFGQAAFYACKTAKIPNCGRVVVHIENHAISARDQDNLVASMKPILDAIVDANVVDDDDEGHMQIRVLPTVRVRHRPQEKLVLYIEPI